MHSQALYERLKEQGLIVVPGHYFFPGIADKAWSHQYQCLRLNYAQDEAKVREGIRILAEVVNPLLA